MRCYNLQIQPWLILINQNNLIEIPRDIIYIVFEHTTPPLIKSNDISQIEPMELSNQIHDLDRELFRNIHTILSISKNWRALFREYVILIYYKITRKKCGFTSSLTIFTRKLRITKQNINSINNPQLQKYTKFYIDNSKNVITFLLNGLCHVNDTSTIPINDKIVKYSIHFHLNRPVRIIVYKNEIKIIIFYLSILHGQHINAILLKSILYCNTKNEVVLITKRINNLIYKKSNTRYPELNNILQRYEIFT